ncbi:hypothetical protein CXB49_12965 [Chromobacterium sp. ATCC 53434]|uniref:hypothetical protein n=1 Tax=Chromobacterium sp. (strain ATCC 53434 / SC 14030) TaxID=2059672 RepID=UPI000C77C315|nr:hypothetical protein [Chromobacterium sp. ATCC 53434]AUH51659.1 hypothetical protein CXB49_12965 [Chromobacterium sp. ATCC 53434]
MAITANFLEIKFKDDSSTSKKGLFANDAHQVGITVRLRGVDGSGKVIKDFRPDTIGGLTFAYLGSGLRIPFFGYDKDPGTDYSGPLVQHKSKTQYYRDLPVSAFYQEEVLVADDTSVVQSMEEAMPVANYASQPDTYYADELEWGNDPASGIFWMNIYFQAKKGAALGSREIYAVWQPDPAHNGVIFDTSGKTNAALKSILAVDVVPPIDYSVLSNWQFPTSSSETHWNIKSTVEIKSKQKGWVGPLHDHSYEAKSRYAKFIVKSIPYQKNSRFALESVYDLSNHFNTIPVDSDVEYTAGDITLATDAVAVYFKGGGRSNVYAVFVSPYGSHVGFLSGVTQVVPLQAFNHRYRIQLHDQNIPVDGNPPDGFAIYVWNLDFDMDNTEQEGWRDRQVEVKLNIKDVYGNSGMLQIPSVISEAVLG